MVIVKVHHIRAAKICTRGARVWFDRNGLSWDDFISDGLPSDLLEKFEDALVNRVIAVAREEFENGRRWR